MKSFTGDLGGTLYVILILSILFFSEFLIIYLSDTYVFSFSDLGLNCGYSVVLKGVTDISFMSEKYLDSSHKHLARKYSVLLLFSPVFEADFKLIVISKTNSISFLKVTASFFLISIYANLFKEMIFSAVNIP